MKYPSSTVIIICLYVALTVGFVPHHHNQYRQLSQTHLPSAPSSITSSEVLNYLDAKFGRKQQLVDVEVGLDLAILDESLDIPADLNIAQLWKRAKRTIVSLAVIPLLLGGSAFNWMNLKFMNCNIIAT